MRKIRILTSYIFQLFTVVSWIDFLKSLPGLHRRISIAISYLLKKPKTGYFPSSITLELTNVCNLNCIMCPSQKQTRDKGYLNRENFIKLLTEVSDSLEVIEFSFMGETLIHPEYDWFIKEAKRWGIKTSLSTNASFLDEINAQKLVDSGLDNLIISIDDKSNGNYEQIRKGANFEKTMKHAKRFLELNNGRIFTTIQKVHMSVNEDAVWDYIEEMGKLGADIIRLKPFRNLDKTKVDLRTKKIKNASSIQCPYIWRVPVFTWKGDLVPCGVDFDASMVLGSIGNGTIREAWNGAKMQEMRNIHSSGNKDSINLCNGCDVLDFSKISFAISTVFDGLNFRKVLSIFQTIKILITKL